MDAAIRIVVAQCGLQVVDGGKGFVATTVAKEVVQAAFDDKGGKAVALTLASTHARLRRKVAGIWGNRSLFARAQVVIWAQLGPVYQRGAKGIALLGA